MTQNRLKVAVIGAGIGGLAAAIRLARAGLLVEVFEQAAHPGGKIREFRQEGFRFDTGPSLFTLPELVDELLDDELKFDYRKLDVITKYFFEDGTQLTAYADVNQFAGEVAQKTDIPASSVLDYLEQAGKIYQLTAPVFIFNSFHRLGKLLTWQNLKRLVQFFRLKAFSTLHQTNTQAFPDKRLVQLFDRYATYNGSNPYKTPGTLSVISHLEHQLGAYFPKQGMYKIVSSLFEQARGLGVQFHFSTSVSQLLVRNRQLVGIRVNEKERDFDCVVCDIDIHQFYSNLFPDKKRLQKIERMERSSSALIFYWGMKKRFPQLDLHNIFFSENYEEEFACLFEKKTISNDPTVYVFISSKEIKTDAPDGMENWFVMVNAPAHVGQDWTKLEAQVRQTIIKKLNRRLGEKLEEQILFEKVLDPVKIEDLTGSFQGAMYGSSSNSPFAAFNRHANFRHDLPGVYFVGGSVHPGGGIPLCLSSAKIVAEMVEEKIKRS